MDQSITTQQSIYIYIYIYSLYIYIRYVIYRLTFSAYPEVANTIEAVACCCGHTSPWPLTFRPDGSEFWAALEPRKAAKHIKA